MTALLNNPPGGSLQKLMIYAYTNVNMGDSDLASIPDVPNPYSAMINPENYTVDIKYVFGRGQGHGTTGRHQQFKVKLPEEMSFDFLFDNTGIIDGNPRTDVGQDVENFKKFLMDYEGNSHQPRFFKFVWGSSLFKGRCSALSINYKLFKQFNPWLKQTYLKNPKKKSYTFKIPDLGKYRSFVFADHTGAQ